MNPIHKEKYVLSLETFKHFTLDQNKEKIAKKKNGIKLTAWIQIIVSILFLGAVIVNKPTGVMVFCVMAVIVGVTGIRGLVSKYPKYDRQIEESVENSYKGKEFDQNWFDVKFFDTYLRYSSGEAVDELHYVDFYRFVENSKYFGVHFVTGDMLLFNPDCNIERIKEIINTYRKNIENEQMEAEKVEDVMDTVVEEIAEVILD